MNIFFLIIYFPVLPILGHRCLQTRPTPNSNPKFIQQLCLFGPSTRISQKDGLNFKNKSVIDHLVALSITNGNVISPSIQPPGLNQAIEEPENFNHIDIEIPFTTLINDISEKNLNIMPSFDLPPTESQNDFIEAAVMIQIRRQKMKKHKLRKLRKRMKFEWAKRNQRRELRKEKQFQADLLGQIKEAEKFSAEEYVAEKLSRSKIVQNTREKSVVA